MPQMAPMSWMMIYLYFMLIMLMFITKIYFNMNNSMNSKSYMFSVNKNEKTWKW
uniref:ATP synthase complex subunit 8 n=1 Tax=Micadina brachyptera TaxID=2783688 RepID=A0A7T3CJ59_9NEOP|nr:ATP synthase F0 subunit 8 [Micadina brachyptera]